MTTLIQFKRGNLANLGPVVPQDGEPLFTLDVNRLHIGDGGVKRVMGVLYALDRIAAPTVNDDAGDGFSVGSLWLDTTADKAYVCIDSTTGAAVWQQFTPQPTATNEGVWRYDATSAVMADPGAGKLRTNAAPGSATAIAISKTTDAGADVANFLRSLAQGDGVYIQDKNNSANWARYTLSAAPIDNTTWFQLPLTLVSSAGVAPSNNSPLAVVFSTAGGGGGGGITQLTGDVTAGPGSGSVAATIAPNAVTNAQLRDSAGVSVIGRSANSTGDPADIVASADGQVLTRTAGALLFAAPPAAPLDIAGLTAADVALLDNFPIYDVSASANRKATISHVGGVLATAPGGRLTLVSGNPTGELPVGVTTGTVRYCPYLHNRIDLWDGTRWQSATFAELSVAFTTIANVDIFAFLSGGAAALDTATWSSITDRAPAVTLSLTDGRYTMTGDKTRLYLGTIRSGVAGGGVSDDERSRYVWNMYNRLPRLLKRKETTTSWTWTSGSYHAANANAQNYVDVCRGLAEDPVFLTVQAYGLNSGAACVLGVGIGLDRNDGNDAYIMGGISPLASQGNQVYALYAGRPGIGRRYFYWVEASGLTSGTTSWFSTVGNGLISCGMFGYTWA